MMKYTAVTDYVLQEGDIVSIDNVIDLDGGLADSCWTYTIER